MNKRIKMAAGGGIFALALAVAGGGYYYFHTQKDTPAYAIKTVSKSIEDHDVKEFHRVVNVDSVLDSGYDGFVDGMTSPGIVATSDARETIKNFTQILHAPLMLSLKAAIDSYIETGELNKEENIIHYTGYFSSTDGYSGQFDNKDPSEPHWYIDCEFDENDELEAICPTKWLPDMVDVTHNAHVQELIKKLSKDHLRHGMKYREKIVKSEIS